MHYSTLPIALPLISCEALIFNLAFAVLHNCLLKALRGGSEKHAMVCCSDQAELGDEKWDKRFQLSFQSLLRYIPDQCCSVQQDMTPAGHVRHLSTGSSAGSSSTRGEEGASRSASESSQEWRQMSLSAEPVESEAAFRAIAEGSLSEGTAKMSSADRAPEGRLQLSEADNAKEAVSSGHLHAAAEITAHLQLFPPFTAVPGFLLSYTGGLIATALLQALIPTLLELLGRDYQEWALGKERTGAE